MVKNKQGKTLRTEWNSLVLTIFQLTQRCRMMNTILIRREEMENLSKDSHAQACNIDAIFQTHGPLCKHSYTFNKNWHQGTALMVANRWGTKHTWFSLMA
jgi:hypothetical protein